MAYEDKPFQDDEENKNTQQNPLAQNSGQQQGGGISQQEKTVTGGESGEIASTTPKSSANPVATSSQRASGRFTNLQNFVNANKNFNKEGGGLAGSIETKIGQQRQDAENNLKKQQNEFDNLYSNENKRIQDVTNQAKQSTQQLGSTSAPSQTLDLTDAQGKISAGAGLTYNGPSDYKDASGLQTAADKLTSVKDSTKSEAGRFGLLNQYFNKPTYSYGQQKLDQLLLQADPNQAARLEAAGENASKFSDTLNSAKNNLLTQVKAGQGLANTNRDTIINEARNAGQGLISDLGNRASQFNTSQQASAKDVSNRETIDALKAAGYKVTDPSYLKSIGVPEDMATVNIGGINIPIRYLSNQIQGNAAQATTNNIDPEALARYNALAGVQGLGLTQEAASSSLDRNVNNSVSDRLKTAASTLSNRLASQGLDKGYALEGNKLDPFGLNTLAGSFNPETTDLTNPVSFSNDWGGVDTKGLSEQQVREQLEAQRAFWNSLKG